MRLTHEHEQVRDTVKRWIAEQVNPHVDAWEEAETFPAHEVFKQLGDLGLLGLDKPVEDGGMGLDFSYAALLAETLAGIDCGGVPMAIGVQTDMCTPALAKHGSPVLRKEFAIGRPADVPDAPNHASLVAARELDAVVSGEEVAAS